MPKITSILCPVDFSEFFRQCVRIPQSIASHYDAKLVLQHVMYWSLEFLGDFNIPDWSMRKNAANGTPRPNINFGYSRHAIPVPR